MNENIHTAIGVFGVVVNEKSDVLLVLSKDRGWEPPQGFIERCESPTLALHREILEETGYKVKAVRLTGVYHCVKDRMPILSICFLCEACGLISDQVEESLAVQWVEKTKLGTFITHESHLLRVMEALTRQISVSDYSLNPFEVIRSMKFPGH